MIRKSGEYTVENRPSGGSKEIFEIRHKFSQDETFGKARVCAEVIFEPGYCIPMHSHETDTEIYMVLEGELVSISEDGSEEPFAEGDYMVTGGGASHSVRNDSGKRVRMMAIIIN